MTGSLAASLTSTYSMAVVAPLSRDNHKCLYILRNIPDGKIDPGEKPQLERMKYHKGITTTFKKTF